MSSRRSRPRNFQLTSLPYAQAELVAAQLSSSDREVRTGGLALVKESVPAENKTEADQVLEAHPEGFSTSRHDLLGDLLP
jgi:hypothetical protein